VRLDDHSAERSQQHVIEQHVLDLLLLDVNIPGPNGLQVLEAEFLPVMVVKYPDGWSMVRLDRNGEVLASVSKQPTRKVAWAAMRSKLGLPPDE
jgi:hypothetical protein